MDVNAIILELLESEKFNDWIFDKIINRLYYRGEDIKERKLQTDVSKLEGFDPSYAKYTILVKEGLKKRIDGKKKGDSRTSNVTLSDQGNFYESFALEVRSTFAEITAQFEKTDGHIQENFEMSYATEEEFEENILNLTDDEINQLLDIMSNDIESLLYVEIEKRLLQDY